MYCAKTDEPGTALRYTGSDQFAAFYWVDDKIAYVMSGPSDREQLEKVTKAVYEQVDKTGAKKL
jgi:anti-sigma factor RsiW